MLLIATPALLDHRRCDGDRRGAEHLARMATEWMFRFCDRVTRRTGYLTKYVRIIDLSGVRLSHISRDFQRRGAQIAKLLEEHYPQLLGNVFLCHAPGFAAIFAELRQFMPRVVEGRLPPARRSTPYKPTPRVRNDRAPARLTRRTVQHCRGTAAQPPLLAGPSGCLGATARRIPRRRTPSPSPSSCTMKTRLSVSQFTFHAY